MNLRDWALSQGIHPQTAYRWYRTEKSPVPAPKVGQLILVGDLASEDPKHGSSVIYVRVSSSDQKPDLDRQVARVLAFATEHGYSVDRVVTEVGSALNGHGRKVLSLLSDPEVENILVEHRDRLCRFGADFIEAALAAQSRNLVVVDSAEVDNDLVRDVTELLTSLCIRLHGPRDHLGGRCRVTAVYIQVCRYICASVFRGSETRPRPSGSQSPCLGNKSRVLRPRGRVRRDLKLCPLVGRCFSTEMISTEVNPLQTTRIAVVVGRYLLVCHGASAPVAEFYIIQSSTTDRVLQH